MVKGYKLIALTTFGLIFICLCQAQEFASSKPILHLMNDSRPVSEIFVNLPQAHFVEIEEAPAIWVKKIRQTLVKKGSSLFVLPDATGRLYEISNSEGHAQITRKDSTVFFGYNFGFIPFCYRDSLYSLGGYGYWIKNGHLRVYWDGEKEWEVVKTNRKIPFNNSGRHIFCYDLKGEKIYVGFSQDSEVRNSPDTLAVLDLPSKKWTILGHINQLVQNQERNYAYSVSSPFGQLILGLEMKFILFDYKNNKVAQLNDNKANEIQQYLHLESMLYFKDSTLFIGSVEKNSLDSVQLSFKDFASTADKIYEPKSESNQQLVQNSSSKLVWFSLVLIPALLIILFYRENQFKRRIKDLLNDKKIAADSQLESINTKSIYDDKEKALINLILINSKRGDATSINELNKFLGVSNKSGEIQKKQRSDSIISINKKYRYMTQTNDLLIKKKRNEQDKRSFEYYIDYKQLNEVPAHLD